VEPLWIVFDRELAAMTQFAVLVRYPGTWATLAESRSGIRSCRRFRAADGPLGSRSEDQVTDAYDRRYSQGKRHRSQETHPQPANR